PGSGGEVPPAHRAPPVGGRWPAPSPRPAPRRWAGRAASARWRDGWDARRWVRGAARGGGWPARRRPRREGRARGAAWRGGSSSSSAPPLEQRPEALLEREVERVDLQRPLVGFQRLGPLP